MPCPDCGGKTRGEWRFCDRCLKRRTGKVRDAKDRVEEQHDMLGGGDDPSSRC